MSLLDEMKKVDSSKFDGICCKLTAENKLALEKEGYIQWGDISGKYDEIFVIDVEDCKCEFIPLPDDGMYKYFYFKDGIPTFKED